MPGLAVARDQVDRVVYALMRSTAPSIQTAQLWRTLPPLKFRVDDPPTIVNGSA